MRLTKCSIEDIREASFVNEMIVYDVGGSRTQRHQWMSYFEDGRFSSFRILSASAHLK